jgi:hypothetical protein
MGKIIVVLDVKDEAYVDRHGVVYNLTQSYSNDELVVEDSFDYPFDGVFRSDYLSVLQDVEVVLSDLTDYRARLTEEQIWEITKEVADEISKGLVAEETNNTIVDVAKRLFGLKEE